jgi:fluoride exporter
VTKYALIAIGGGLGSLCRYLVGLAVMQRYPGSFPLGTFAVNVTGSFLFGLLMTLLTERFSGYPELRFLLVIGFLGGYTTFSSLEYEILQTVRGGGTWMALWYVVASVVVGYTGVWLGFILGTRR